ncbi:glycosyltransferase [Glycomyces sp. YM15]|uniref:glycosyltransferase n=1 Tax=Glycomyces sp. YM15 TaxID=2800446 RepID=UPI001966138E|nr:glycosyltransferase [Glycomyces sp. YM15]
MFRRKPAIALPDDPIYGLTWSIGKEFGGLTNVLLHRNAVFSSLGRRRIDILTLAPNFDTRAAKLRLWKQGYIGKSVRLRNIWEEVASASDAALVRRYGARRRDFEQPAILLPYEGRKQTKRRSADGVELQVDTFRSDGSRLVSDRKDMEEEGTVGGRELTLFTRKGAVVNRWSRGADFYFAWFDHVIGPGHAYLVNDSHFIGKFLHRYRRDNVTTVQVLHNSHLDRDAPDAFGKLSGGKIAIVKNLRSFDMVAPLTVRQAGEIAEADFAGANMTPIPNSRPMKTQAVRHDRDPGDGVMLARFGHQKRVDHAISALTLAHADGSKARLRIFGDGDSRPTLQAQIDKAGANDYVELMGFRSDASAQFATASFSVLSSRFEGMPLVLIEAMAAGCIPVAYDIRYGPSDIITDGVDGFVVPAGDVKALADAVARVSSMPEAALAELRANAQKRAADFSDEAVTRAWVKALVDAKARKTAVRIPKFTPLVQEAFVKEGVLHLRGSLDDCKDVEDRSVALSWSARGVAVYGRVLVAERPGAGGAIGFEAELPLARVQDATGDILDFHVEVETPRGFAKRRVLADESAVLKSDDIELYVTVQGNLSLKVLSLPVEGGPVAS